MYLAIDIGGTKTLFALFTKRGRVIKKTKVKTPENSQVFLRTLESNLENFQKRHIESIVVAIPGSVQNFYTVHFGNRNWDGIDIISSIKKFFSCPIYFENDANLAALFEGYRLSGKTVFLTFSTGIGGGIVAKNRILPESNNFEPGHQTYIYHGQEKEWEDIAAASAIGAAYHIDTATDLRKKSIMKDIADRIYLGIPDIILEHHPDNIILGGPLGKIFQLYVKYLPKIPNVRLRRPKRPNESVIYGCYLYAKQQETS